MKEKNIQMVDLMGQYHKIKQEIDQNIISLIESGKFVNGPIVNEFASNLSTFLNIKNVIPCANGTDALQIALMALDLKRGDEIITTNFSFASSNHILYSFSVTTFTVIGMKACFIPHSSEH